MFGTKYKKEIQEELNTAEANFKRFDVIRRNLEKKIDGMQLLLKIIKDNVGDKLFGYSNKNDLINKIVRLNNNNGIYGNYKIFHIDEDELYLCGILEFNYKYDGREIPQQFRNLSDIGDVIKLSYAEFAKCFISFEG